MLVSGQKAVFVLLHYGFWKADPNFLLVFNTNSSSICNRFEVERLCKVLPGKPYSELLWSFLGDYTPNILLLFVLTIKRHFHAAGRVVQAMNHINSFRRFAWACVERNDFVWLGFAYPGRNFGWLGARAHPNFNFSFECATRAKMIALLHLSSHL